MADCHKFKESSDLTLMIAIRRFLYICFALIHNIISVKNGIYVLCYHSISDAGWRFSNSKEEFLKHISFIHRNFSFINASEFQTYVASGKKLQKPVFLVTFDDGYKDIVSIAKDLETYSVKPVVFLLGEEEKLNRREMDNQLELLSESDVKKLIGYGWSIGSHSLTHSQLNKLSRKEVEKECIDSKSNLEKKYGVPVHFFAYPKGAYSRKVIKAVKKAGYSYAFSMDDELITFRTNPLTIPRIGIDGSHWFDEFKGTITPLAIYFRRFVRKTLHITI